MKKYVLTVVDTGYDSDFTPHVLGIYNSEEEAHFAFIDNMEELIDAAAEMEIDEEDYEKRSLIVDGGRYGAVWNIEEVEVN